MQDILVHRYGEWKMLAIALISGGIDSPVAVYSMLNKNVEIIALHMDNRPFTCERQLNKSMEMIKQLEKISTKNIKFYSMPFGETIQLEIARWYTHKISNTR